ncbi:MAG: pyridoxamine 5'-phosphate oxidase family protein [Bacillota bacterium]|nr:pyridoxamine 5'-phosphate oxidase family protein [Bacillota bacterium]
MTKAEEIMSLAKKLAESCSNVMVGSIGNQDYPYVKSMFKMETNGLKEVWLSTNTSSKRVSHFRSNPKACLYFVDPVEYKGLLLLGKIDILEDLESKKRLWREGFDIYYPKGIADPDYCVLRFTACKGNYYHNLKNIDFEL